MAKMNRIIAENLKKSYANVEIDDNQIKINGKVAYVMENANLSNWGHCTILKPVNISNLVHTVLFSYLSLGGNNFLGNMNYIYTYEEYISKKGIENVLNQLTRIIPELDLLTTNYKEKLYVKEQLENNLQSTSFPCSFGLDTSPVEETLYILLNNFKASLKLFNKYKNISSENLIKLYEKTSKSVRQDSKDAVTVTMEICYSKKLVEHMLDSFNWDFEYGLENSQLSNITSYAQGSLVQGIYQNYAWETWNGNVARMSWSKEHNIIYLECGVTSSKAVNLVTCAKMFGVNLK